PPAISIVSVRSSDVSTQRTRPARESHAKPSAGSAVVAIAPASGGTDANVVEIAPPAFTHEQVNCTEGASASTKPLADVAGGSDDGLSTASSLRTSEDHS